MRYSRAYLDLLLQFALEARPDNFPLTGLEAVSNGWDRANVISHGKKNEFLVDEIGVRNLVRVVIEVRSRLQCAMSRCTRRTATGMRENAP